MLVLDLDGRDELGTPVKKRLIVEMLGRTQRLRELFSKITEVL